MKAKPPAGGAVEEGTEGLIEQACRVARPIVLQGLCKGLIGSESPPAPVKL
jgi:hypothetical protein